MQAHTSITGICPWHHKYECDTYLTNWHKSTFPNGVPRPKERATS